MTKELNNEFLLPLKLQLFGEAGAGAGADDNNDNPDDNKDDDDNSDDEDGDDSDDDDDDDEDDDSDEDIKKKKKNKKGKSYSQDEVDRIVKNRLAREAKKQAKANKSSKEDNKDDKNKADKANNEASEALMKQMAKIQEKLVKSEMKSAMTSAGIDPNKVDKAMKLIDMDDVLDENDEVDAKLLRREVKSLLKDFPNLKKASSASGGFKFGSESNNINDSKISGELSSIFGNTTKK